MQPNKTKDKITVKSQQQKNMREQFAKNERIQWCLVINKWKTFQILRQELVFTVYSRNVKLKKKDYFMIRASDLNCCFSTLTDCETG